MDAILVATDGSPCAGLAVDFAIDLARDARATLHVVSVRPSAKLVREGTAVLVVEDEHAGEDVARAVAEQAAAAGLTAEAHTAEGGAADAIVDLAHRLGVDMIVVGSRGHGPLVSRIVGSVSRKVVLHSPIPVTVVHGAEVPAS